MPGAGGSARDAPPRAPCRGPRAWPHHRWRAPAGCRWIARVAATIRARLAGRATAPFRYRDYGNLATIGRRAAVVDLHGLRFSGFPAWAFWLAAHIFFLIGFRNRLVVLLDWAMAYWTYQRNARIVLGGRGGEP